MDPGCGIYTKEYFGDERYSLIYTGSHGHSVPIIEGHYQQAGEQYAAKWIQIEPDIEGDVLVLDLTKAYASENLISFTRSCQFHTHTLRIEDQYSFVSKPVSIIERFVTFIEPNLQRDGEIMLQAENGISTKLHYDCRELEYRCEKVTFLPDTIDQAHLYLIDLLVKEPEVKKSVVVDIVIHSNLAEDDV
ncbi:hypothetical protein D3C76_764800 [compost metagenome]